MGRCLTDSLHVQTWRHFAQVYVIIVRSKAHAQPEFLHLQVTLKLLDLRSGPADHSCAEMLQPMLVYTYYSIPLLPDLLYVSVPNIAESAQCSSIVSTP